MVLRRLWLINAIRFGLLTESKPLFFKVLCHISSVYLLPGQRKPPNLFNNRPLGKFQRQGRSTNAIYIE